MFLYLFFYLTIGTLIQSMVGAEISQSTASFDYTKLTYQQRAKYSSNAIGKQLFDIIIKKKTNIAVGLDVESLEKIIEIVRSIGPYICLIKIHAETLEDFFAKEVTLYDFTETWSPTFKHFTYGKYSIDILRELADQYNFLIMEDRKFSDVENTVALQYTGGLLKPAFWSDLVTTHSLSGPGMIQTMHKALKDAQITAPRGVVMISQMNSKNNLLSSDYTLHTLMHILDLKKENINLSTAIITRSKIYFNDETLDYGTLRMTLGIGLPESANDNQQYITPEKAFNEMGSDIAIIGSTIYNSKDPVATTKNLQQLCWNAYTNRLPQK